MQHVQGLSDVQVERPSIVTVGVFDGVHRGHQSLLRQLVDAAHQQDKLAVVVTFFPHPDVVLGGIEAPYYLNRPERRAALLGELGIDVVVTLPFDDHIRHIRAADFVDQLVRYVKMAEIWATPDFAMGYQREGNVAFLQSRAAALGYTVQTIEPLADANTGDIVSSTSIRQALSEGDMRRVDDLLGRPYRVGGRVVKGQQRGRTIGFPTANVANWPLQLLPANGVYACWAYLSDERYLAVTNIGQRPTFDGIDTTVEAHLLGFDRDIYGQHLDLDFVEHLRGEVKFSGIEALVAQIKQDILVARTKLQETL